MAFAIKHGLFRLNITDYHAILGVPLDDNPKNIRLKYLRIAQQLHPDTCKGDQIRKSLANSILSKLVNPAYEQLSRKNCFAEHQLVLTQIGKRLAEKSEQMNVVSKQAKDLIKSQHKLEIVYNEHLRKLVNNQYQDLDKVTDKIAVISELNLVYLMIKQGRGINREENIPTKASTKQNRPSPPKQPTPASTKASSVKQPKPPQPPSDKNLKEETTSPDRVSSFIRRAKEYVEKKSYSQAIAELRDGLKIDPNNSTCHGMMGKIYLLQNQITMAKVHISKAHKANPKDPIVIEVRKELNKLTKNQDTKGKNSKAKGANTAKSENKGLFSGFFGAKKK